ncbi:MAG: S9 family peptidase [Elusimicrobia bacterium]|nr:S9 family peptidase [Elusimicrobiota bacterium]
MSRIPLEILFGNPERASAQISPDGKSLACLAPKDGVLNIWAGPVEGPYRAITDDRKRGIRSYFWAENSASLLYVQDRDGDENWHLYQAPAHGDPARDLTPFPGAQAHIIGVHWRFPDQVLVGINHRDPRIHDAYRIDLGSGACSMELENPGDVMGWLPDEDFRIRAARAITPQGGTELRVLDGGAWKVFMSWGPEDQGAAHGFTADNRGLYVESSLDSDTTVLWEMSLDGGSQRRLASWPGADLSGVLTHPRRAHAQAAAFFKERLHWVILDEEIKPDFEALAKLCEGDYHLLSRDAQDRYWIVLFNLDRKPPRYYLYDRKTRQGRFLFSTRPRLEEYQLSAMSPVTIKARDGLELPAYLTLPQRVEPKALPLVLDVHGGPWARDSWGFNPETQWLADRGYAVLQVNFRGSQGFGKRFLHAGDRQWGAKMQDDLTDAVHWAVQRGFADPRRVAIYGGSYGGYAALAGAAFTPELYCCAVDVVGPSNIITLIRSIPPYWEPMRKIFDLRVGDVDKEPEFLKERSPLFHADRIQIPLLIAQGANDPRVKKAESEMIVEALRRRGKPVDYLLFEDEGHGFARPENRLKFYAHMEDFLGRYLAAAQPAGARP